MTWTRWILVVAVLAVHAASEGLQARTGGPASSSPARPGEIDVNPYGDPIWQTEPGRSKPQRHVKRKRLKQHVHAKRVRPKPGRHVWAAKPARHARAAKPLRPKRAPVGRPLNILPPPARAR
jgi:hypothetical protein